jgi:hypothetical protein
MAPMRKGRQAVALACGFYSLGLGEGFSETRDGDRLAKVFEAPDLFALRPDRTHSKARPCARGSRKGQRVPLLGPKTFRMALASRRKLYKITDIDYNKLTWDNRPFAPEFFV